MHMRLIADEHERLDRFVARLMPEHSRSKLAKLIDSGDVSVDGVGRKASFALRPGMEVEVRGTPETAIHDLTPADIPLDVLYEDEHLLVVNKPRGMASHPAPGNRKPTLVNALLSRSHALSATGGEFRPGIVHRLDKDTTGLMVVAKSDAAHRHLQAQIKAKTAERRYVALVWGGYDQDRFSVDAPLARNPFNRLQMKVDPKGKPAVTHFKVLTKVDAMTLLGVRLETGRTHQIRVHVAWMGHPVRGDDLYSTGEWRQGALQLHAAYLAFQHPVTGEDVQVWADPPHDFLAADQVSRTEVENW